MSVDRKLKYGVAVMISLVGCCLTGCDGGPKTHAVSGSLELRGGDSAQLAGSHLELTRSDDPTVRAAGVIDERGRFQIESLSDGQVKTGALEGSYQARLILNDEGDGRKKPKIHKKYLDRKTSGWTVQVPSPGEVTLTLTQP
jgi:hypothetical protein